MAQTLFLTQTNSQSAFDSDSIVNDDNSCCVSNSDSISPEFPTPDVAALKLLSANIESLFQPPDLDFCSDARIVVPGGREISVHRCILSARSPFFRQVFRGNPGKGERKFELKRLAKDIEVCYDALVAVVCYLYSGKVKPPPIAVCVCVDEDCPHQACRPAVDFLVQVLYTSFVFQIAEMVALYQRHLLEIIDKVAADDLLVILSAAYICKKACERLLTKCIESVVKSDIDIITLENEKTLPQDVVKQILDSRSELGLGGPETNSFPDKHVRRLHRALQSDDVELVRMLLKEGHTTLNEACALHYAVAYCDSKITAELLDIGLADVNHRNARGYTVLHVAAMRREPETIVSLLTKGARPSDLTLDGRKAFQISKRLTKSVDYHTFTEEGKASPKERLCIEILEQAERREPLLGDASLSLAMAGEDLHMKLLYLENRVGLAKLLFPMEAKVAMDIAHVDSTLDFQYVPISKLGSENQRTTVDLNESPFMIKEGHLSRFRALSRTVELGKRFFPRCSAVLNKIMDDDDLSELACLEKGTPEERILKKKRYIELQDQLTKAFSEDMKIEMGRSAMSSSSSSTSMDGVRSKIARRS